MAQKAQLIKYAMESLLLWEEREKTVLLNQYETFRRMLIHDLTEAQFADMYAQTIAYGLFAARLYDPTLPTFSRQEAEKLIPKSTPFVRRLFRQMSMDDEFDDRINHIIDSLVDIFLHCDVALILEHHWKKTAMTDPIIHFYETFLGEYDPRMRKQRGVYYTPEPVVTFIIRGVDSILRNEFGLADWLADTSKITTEFTTNEYDWRRADKRKKEKREVHRVQLLDPATWTGTFLHETISYIHQKYFKNNPWIRKSYIQKDLLPRIRGFEILMASYTMAHLKIWLTIQETLWINPHDIANRENMHEWLDQRLNIYLTNSLEEPHDHISNLFSKALSDESQRASQVKKEQPIMIVMGNPPYSGISSNKWERIMNLIEEYKYIDGEHFGERKHRLWDDYVKFIRYAEHFVSKNNEWIVAYICPHWFLDNPTFRGMRRHLLTTFDKIYTIDLHGNTKKKETDPNGGRDDNVFDIQQGVAITFFVKNKTSAGVNPSVSSLDTSPSQGRMPTDGSLPDKGGSGRVWLATVYHYDLYGKRDSKYKRLDTNNLDDIPRTTLKNVAPHYFFVPKDFESQEKYEKGIRIDELFSVNVTGIVTAKDRLVISQSKKELKNKMNYFFEETNSDEIIRQKFRPNKKSWKYLPWDSRGRKLSDVRKKHNYDWNNIQSIAYRPFDNQYIYYHPDMVDRWRWDIMQHFLIWENIGLIMPKQVATEEQPGCLVSKNIGAHKLVSKYNINSVFPLYIYSTDLEWRTTRDPNFTI